MVIAFDRRADPEYGGALEALIDEARDHIENEQEAFRQARRVGASNPGSPISFLRNAGEWSSDDQRCVAAHYGRLVLAFEDFRNRFLGCSTPARASIAATAHRVLGTVPAEGSFAATTLEYRRQGKLPKSALLPDDIN